MTEDFLHYLWKHLNFNQSNLRVSGGDLLEILNNGIHNRDSGPDFAEAVIKLDGQTWAGSVEIHVRSSDWYRHHHQNDDAYQNVILHVVYEHDKEVQDRSGNNLPVLVLQGRFDEYEYWRFEQLLGNRDPIPCASIIGSLDQILVNTMLERAACERLEQKSSFIRKVWERNHRNWYETSFQLLAYGLGLKVNAQPMLDLAARLGYRLATKESGTPLRLEALLLGCSGLLEAGLDDYTSELWRKFKFLRRKYGLAPMQAVNWKYSRMRPVSFPERRIAILAAMISMQPELPQLLLTCEKLTDLLEVLAVKPSEYWQKHHRLGSAWRDQQNHSLGGLSQAVITVLVINVIIPLRYAYDKFRSTGKESDVLDLLAEFKAENNRISRLMASVGMRMDSASDSQGAIHLYRHYCSPKNCLNCAIGIKILRTG